MALKERTLEPQKAKNIERQESIAGAIVAKRASPGPVEQWPKSGWIGVDLDGTLAHYEKGQSAFTIGEPIPAVVSMVKQAMENGYEVRIFTARVGPTANPEMVERVMQLIREWCLRHLGRVLKITAAKDHHMIELWDDRAIGFIQNSGVGHRESKYAKLEGVNL